MNNNLQSSILISQRVSRCDWTFTPFIFAILAGTTFWPVHSGSCTAFPSRTVFSITILHCLVLNFGAKWPCF